MRKKHISTYPFVGDNLVGLLLQLVETQPSDGVGALQGLGLGWVLTACRRHVVQVQVLLVGQALLLQGLVQNVWMVPNLEE